MSINEIHYQEILSNVRELLNEALSYFHSALPPEPFQIKFFLIVDVNLYFIEENIFRCKD